jgi:hypothetical protein
MVLTPHPAVAPGIFPTLTESEREKLILLMILLKVLPKLFNGNIVSTKAMMMPLNPKFQVSSTPEREKQLF